MSPLHMDGILAPPSPKDVITSADPTRPPNAAKHAIHNRFSRPLLKCSTAVTESFTRT
jgi:hypothetical protein